MSPSIIPNLLTVGRVLLIAPLVYLLLVGNFFWALILAVAAGITDLLDGWLARRYGWQSRFGSLADPLADKMLMLAVFLTLAWLGELSWWLVGIVVVRDLVIVCGGLVYHVRFEPVTANPTQLSKFNTFCQVLLMWVVLVRLAGLPIPIELLHGLVWLVAVLAVLTLIHYVWVWSRKAVIISRARKAG